MNIFISDLDGTLLHPDGLLTTQTRQTVIQLLEADVPFTVASGRSVVSIQSVIGDLPLKLPIIAFNGGFISDLATGEHIQVIDIATGIASRLYHRCLDAGMIPIVSTTSPQGDRVYVREPIANHGILMYVQGQQSFGDPRLRLTDDPRRGLDETVTCLTIIDRRARLVPLVDSIERDFGAHIHPHFFDDIYTTGWAWYTIHPAGARKSNAIRTVIEMTGNNDRRWVSFGDQLNDIDMIRDADHGVAVQNAVPEIKAVADEIIGPNHEDSVAEYLRRSL
ncbi:MAG: HAD family hydrolase [Myxococcota bacterium]